MELIDVHNIKDAKFDNYDLIDRLRDLMKDAAASKIITLHLISGKEFTGALTEVSRHHLVVNLLNSDNKEIWIANDSVAAFIF